MRLYAVLCVTFIISVTHTYAGKNWDRLLQIREELGDSEFFFRRLSRVKDGEPYIRIMERYVLNGKKMKTRILLTLDDAKEFSDELTDIYDSYSQVESIDPSFYEKGRQLLRKSTKRCHHRRRTNYFYIEDTKVTRVGKDNELDSEHKDTLHNVVISVLLADNPDNPLYFPLNKDDLLTFIISLQKVIDFPDGDATVTTQTQPETTTPFYQG